MTGEQLRRYLVEAGAGNSAVDVILRRLRALGTIKTGGRGFYAHQLQPSEAAWLLLAVAGSGVAAGAEETLSRLVNLERRGGGEAFTNSLIGLLRSPEAAGSIQEVRVGQNQPFAAICYDDGRREVFVAPSLVNELDFPHFAFLVEGVIGGGLLFLVASALQRVGADNPE